MADSLLIHCLIHKADTGDYDTTLDENTLGQLRINHAANILNLSLTYILYINVSLLPRLIAVFSGFSGINVSLLSIYVWVAIVGVLM